MNRFVMLFNSFSENKKCHLYLPNDNISSSLLCADYIKNSSNFPAIESFSKFMVQRSSEQEPWDLKNFIAEYNLFAKGHGWFYEKNQHTNDLQDYYEKNPNHFSTIKEFAQMEFDYEQSYS